MTRISDAAHKGDLDLVRSLTNKASELSAIRDQLLALEDRLATLQKHPTLHARVPSSRCFHGKSPSQLPKE